MAVIVGIMYTSAADVDGSRVVSISLNGAGGGAPSFGIGTYSNNTTGEDDSYFGGVVLVTSGECTWLTTVLVTADYYGGTSASGIGGSECTCSVSIWATISSSGGDVDSVGVAEVLCAYADNCGIT